jgi:hypothetical protein
MATGLMGWAYLIGDEGKRRQGMFKEEEKTRRLTDVWWW